MAALAPLAAPARPKSSYLVDLLTLIAIFQRATGRSDYFMSDTLFNRGNHLKLLRQGERDVHSELIERSIVWLSLNWPDNAVWPAHIAKPSADRVALYADRSMAADAADGGAA